MRYGDTVLAGLSSATLSSWAFDTNPVFAPVQTNNITYSSCHVSSLIDYSFFIRFQWDHNSFDRQNPDIPHFMGSFRIKRKRPETPLCKTHISILLRYRDSVLKEFSQMITLHLGINFIYLFFFLLYLLQNIFMQKITLPRKLHLCLGEGRI